MVYIALMRGSIINPFAGLAEGLRTSRVKAGQAIYLMGGTHRLTAPLQVTVSGTGENPVIVRPYTGGHAVIDLDAYTLDWQGGGVDLYDLELCSQAVGNRVSSQASAAPNDVIQCWLDIEATINMYGLSIHDVSNFGWWSSAQGGRLADSDIYHCGWIPPANFGPWGHGMYTQNRHSSSTKYVTNCLFGRSLGLGFGVRGSENTEVGNYSIQNCTSWSGDDRFSGYSVNGQNIIVEDCVFWNPVIIENALEGNGIALRNCFIHVGSSHLLALDSTGFEVTGCTIVGATSARLIQLPDGDLSGYNIDNNFYHSSATPIWQWGTQAYTSLAEWQAATGLDANSTYSNEPPALRTIVTPCEYSERRIAHITIIDFSEPETKPVDVSALPLVQGNIYRLSNAQDRWSDFEDFVYDGSGELEIALAGRTVATPQNLDAPVDTIDARFGAWVLEHVLP